MRLPPRAALFTVLLTPPEPCCLVSPCSCATCGNPMSERMRPSWCPGCKATPFCSQECHRVLYAQHRAVCSSMLTKPLLPSQVGAGFVAWGRAEGGKVRSMRLPSPAAHPWPASAAPGLSGFPPAHNYHLSCLPPCPDCAADGRRGAHGARRQRRVAAAGGAAPDGRGAAQLPGSCPGCRSRGRGGRVSGWRWRCSERPHPRQQGSAAQRPTPGSPWCAR